MNPLPEKTSEDCFAGFERNILPDWLLLFLLIFPLAMLIRWSVVNPDGGHAFFIVPDSQEYAAGAQSIAQTGKYFLQVGPYRLQPRYSPGFSIFLSFFVMLGLEGQHLWRVNALAGAMNAVVIAFLAYCAALSCRGAGLGPRGRRASRRMAFGAGWICGLGWAVTPASLSLDRHLLSDEMGALCSNLCLLFLWLGLLRSQANRGHQAWIQVSAGIFLGISLAIRQANGLILIPLVLILEAGNFMLSRNGGDRTARMARLAGGAAAAALPVLFVLYRSGYPLTRWSNYEYWAPEFYRSLSRTFQWNYAFRGVPLFNYRVDGELVGHLELACRLLLGIPGLPENGLGLFWPSAAFILFLGSGLYVIRHRRAGSHAFLWIWLAYSYMILAVAFLYGFYFFPAVRFYLPVLGLIWIPVGIVCSWLISGPTFRRTGSGALLTLTVFFLTVWDTRGLIGSSPSYEKNKLTEAIYSHWQKAPEIARLNAKLPFDPVQVQALGLLDLRSVSGRTIWGQLPESVHLSRLRWLGYLADQETIVPLLPLLFPAERSESGMERMEAAAGGRSVELLRCRKPCQVSLTGKVRWDRLYLGYGLTSGSRPSGENRFELELITEEKNKISLFQGVLPAEYPAGDRGWRYQDIDLRAYVGKVVTLSFRISGSDGAHPAWIAPTVYRVDPLKTEPIPQP